MPKSEVKVMRVIARLNVGGPALHCLTLSRSLNRYGYNTTLVTGNPEADEASFEKMFKVGTEGFRLVRLQRLRRMISGLGDIFTLFELISLMRKERPQIVHTHTAKAGVLGRIAARITGVPIVVHTFHGHVLSGYFGATFSALITRLERWLARNTTAIVTLSPLLKRELSERFKLAPASSFRVIPLGRDLHPFFEGGSFRGELRKELGITDPSAVLIGTIGRLVPIKEQRLLLGAFAELKTEIPTHLVLAGEGQLMEELKAQTRRLGLEKRVHFLGWRTDLPKLYADFDLFVLCSRNEGTPLSIIEAFASGCPVVSTAVGGVADMFSPNPLSSCQETEIQLKAEGALVPTEDLKALTTAMSYFVENRIARAQCSQAARISASLYTEEALSERIAQLYQSLLEDRS